MEINTQNAKRVTLADQTAFPSTELMTFGLSKREYFAAMAMQGILSSIYNNIRSEQIPQISIMSVLQADYLIGQLNKI